MSVDSSPSQTDHATAAAPLWRWAVVLIPGLALYFAPLAPFTTPQRHLLAIFTATVIALIAQPVPMGVSVLVAMTLLALTQYSLLKWNPDGAGKSASKFDPVIALSSEHLGDIEP